MGFKVGCKRSGQPGQQLGLKKHAAVAQGLCQALGVAELADVRQAGQQLVYRGAHFARLAIVVAQLLQGREQALQGRLAALLGA
ncbi:hypothetical protein D9M71_611040 [compost metagenome]